VSGDEHREVKHYLVIDLEATTEDGSDDERTVPRHEMETIEIGAVLVRANTLAVEAGSRPSSARCGTRRSRRSARS